MNAPPPPWLEPLVAAAAAASAGELSAVPVPAASGRERHAAVLVLFGEGPAGPDVLLIERSAHLRNHPGQPAFPGGAVEPGDAGPAATALREAAEETGLDPGGVRVLAELAPLWLPPSGFRVVPVLAWWERPSEVRAGAHEVAAVARVPLSVLSEPANRCCVRAPSGYVGPAFDVDGMFVWGFTAGLLDRLLALGGWERPWDRSRVRELPEPARALAARHRARAGGAPPA